jgi:hypothetical protein
LKRTIAALLTFKNQKSKEGLKKVWMRYALNAGSQRNFVFARQ